jgi:hypothetical protein
MNGGRILARGLVVALALIGAGAVAWTGTAQANDRASDVVCIDPSTGEWRATMTFTSIDVHDGHPVTVTFGSDSATLTAAGPDGAVTLRQDFGGDDASGHRSWSIVRNGVVERGGSEMFSRPEGCAAPGTTEPPGSGPPVTEPGTGPPATEPPSAAPPTTGPAGPSPTNPPPATTVPRPRPLPVTGRGATGLVVVIGLAVVVAGVLAVRGARRHPDQLIGD